MISMTLTTLVSDNYREMEEQAFSAIVAEDLSLSISLLHQCLSKRPGFNPNYGLAVSYFLRATADPHSVILDELMLTIQYGEEALAIRDDHLDLHVIVGKSYATVYYLTHNPTYKLKARNEYRLAESLVHQRKNLGIERQLKLLLDELEGDTHATCYVYD